MLEPLVPPESQYCDANGDPIAGGTITTYIPGTDTLKNTWSDMEGTALNENPIVLDAAGRALIYGVGDFRIVLKDAAGNLIYDQETSAIDSSAFVTMAEVNDAVQAETDRAEAAEGTLTLNLNAEIARATAAEAHLLSLITTLASQFGPSGVVGTPGSHTTNAYFMQDGISSTNSSGFVTVTYPVPYTVNPGVWIQVVDAAFTDIVATIAYTTTAGVDVYINQAGTGRAAQFIWIAFGY